MDDNRNADDSTDTERETEGGSIDELTVVTVETEDDTDVITSIAYEYLSVKNEISVGETVIGYTGETVGEIDSIVSGWCRNGEEQYWVNIDYGAGSFWDEDGVGGIPLEDIGHQQLNNMMTTLR